MEETLMKYRKLADALSVALHPFLLPLYLTGILLTMTSYALYPGSVKLYVLWVVVLYAVVIPLLSLGVLRSFGRISSFRLDERRERFWPLLIGTASYLLCALTFAKIQSAGFLCWMMVAAACCELFCCLVTLKWKVSLHLTGMGAAVAMLSVAAVAGVGNLLLPFVVAILAAGSLASARLYLGCHNIMQVAVGFCSGLLIVALTLSFFLFPQLRLF